VNVTTKTNQQFASQVFNSWEATMWSQMIFILPSIWSSSNHPNPLQVSIKTHIGSFFLGFRVELATRTSLLGWATCKHSLNLIMYLMDWGSNSIMWFFWCWCDHSSYSFKGLSSTQC